MRHPIPLQMFVLAVTSFLFVGCRWQQVVEDPLPAIADIREVTASYFDSDVNQKISFNVPLTQLPTSSLPLSLRFSTRVQLNGRSRPNGYDPFQRTAISYRLLRFRADRARAFAAGETFEQRIYYRGGSSQKLLDALRKAYEVASKTKVD